MDFVDDFASCTLRGLLAVLGIIAAFEMSFGLYLWMTFNGVFFQSLAVGLVGMGILLLSWLSAMHLPRRSVRFLSVLGVSLKVLLFFSLVLGLVFVIFGSFVVQWSDVEVPERHVVWTATFKEGLFFCAQTMLLALAAYLTRITRDSVQVQTDSSEAPPLLPQRRSEIPRTAFDAEYGLDDVYGGPPQKTDYGSVARRPSPAPSDSKSDPSLSPLTQQESEEEAAIRT
eukprot:CAMPEP_0184555534 /NCGR_PEP_ID=MMETSP0199_2-20130426/37712_1 /TAXON_ID=1112570 /ORGANISM="Thraustochytrium sp., Strain LLF1b" /LENGTH=227 /DNA_ID=CAMNT_0026951879 /DNA_START=87 /DNA_END=766 /DNA_ORIENTATION=+